MTILSGDPTVGQGSSRMLEAFLFVWLFPAIVGVLDQRLQLVCCLRIDSSFIIVSCVCDIQLREWLLSGLLVLTLGAGDATLRVKEQVEPYLLKVANLASSSNARISVSILSFWTCHVSCVQSFSLMGRL